MPESKERGLQMSFSNSFGDASLQMLDRVGFKNIFTHEQVKEWHNIVIFKKIKSFVIIQSLASSYEIYQTDFR